MVNNVDDFTCCFVPLIAKHLSIFAMVRDRDQLQLPQAYAAATFLANNNSIIKYIQYSIALTVLINEFIAEFAVPPNNQPTKYTQTTPTVSIDAYP